MKRLVAVAMLGTLTGCSAIRTEMWTRDQNDYLHPDSQCNPNSKEHLNGIPVMLKVPSHLDVRIVETIYAKHDPTKGQLDVVSFDRPHLNVEYETKYTEKMFFVDPKRVGAGSGSYGFTFAAAAAAGAAGITDSNKEAPEGHGYLSSNKYKADDQTIVQSSVLLSTLIGLKSGTNETAESNLASKMDLIQTTRLVAYRRFDLGTPCVDQEVAAFLDQHMNCCHSCGPKLASADPSISSPIALNEQSSLE